MGDTTQPKYYVNYDQANDMVHAYKTSARGTVHLNVTSNHYNELHYEWLPGPDFIEINESRWNSYKKGVLDHLEKI